MKRLLAVLAAIAATVLLTPIPANAHPLGNFTVNHFHGLRLLPDRIEDNAVIDEAEIPTLQQRGEVDRSGDGVADNGELADYARRTCAALAADVRIEVGGHPVAWRVDASSFAYRPGAANLLTGRTECQLSAQVDLHGAATVRLTDAHRTDRIGWHEITATGAGVGLQNPTVPATSVSDALRSYPDDLLSSPLDQRSVTLRTTADGAAHGAAASAAIANAGPVTRALGGLSNRLNDLTGADHLTPLAGLLAIALALTLGAGHALLPGHGKTVMAAYIAGRRGSYRDAFAVGATVTATHTGGVLLLGLLLTAVASIAGEAVLGWLGVLSGLIIAVVGATLLRSAMNRPAAVAVDRPLAHVAAGVHGHDQSGHHHHHAHPHGPETHHHGQPMGRRGLVGLGIAGGLVPSPSALIVLLSAIALGRTWFGVLLVVAYGVGMAAILTATGLLLVHVHGRLAHHIDALSGRAATITPRITAVLVLLVGIVLVIRAAQPLM
ncbi:ABC-type nickel/cobalt efflux system permease component RcnA [Asanoa ferruginea]|uniref:ABC-type nickel/cobalt efflux system permease component RcnA n=1 Tax=Asanoa ferruginea TaxID=53367 RepID=A0A3D9ZUN2_9ACTN|nr:hypothetical protein [Asanoa ferruginea]REG00888.1 ABC-type nickel/cobalt efflux system permease component RcnA [Asanoa ferruginea]GIF47466.1 hypothetical protein Afe04nite_20050 [Asanoa ferruginea]